MRLGLGLGFNRVSGSGDGTAFSASLMNSLPSIFTFTRPTAATYFENGVLKTASTNTPRFESDGFLMEGSRTNYALHSRNLSNTAWVKTNITAGNIDGLDEGNNTASTLTATSANATALQSVTLASGSRAFSAYVKRLVGSGDVDITLDGGTTWTTVTVTSDWTRVSVTATVTDPEIGFRLVTSSDEIAIDGCQLEDDFPTSIITTTGSQFTRASESCVATDLSFMNRDGSDNWVSNAYLTRYKPSTGLHNGVIANFSANSFSQRIANDYDSRSGHPASERYFVIDSSNQGTLANNTFIADGDIVKSVSSLELNNRKYGASSTTNGAQTQQEDTTATMPQITQLNLGSVHNGIVSFFGHLQQLKIWDRVLTDDEIAGLIGA